jgi:hypothetical protein
MENDSSNVRRPPWVTLALWGLPTRAAVLVYFWLCAGLTLLFLSASLGMALVGVSSAYWIATLVVTCMMVSAGAWYGFAILWMDRYDRWPD